MDRRQLVAILGATGIFTLIASAFTGRKKGVEPQSELTEARIDKSNVRDAIAANALWCVGIEASDPRKIGMFAELLGEPPKGEEWQKFLRLPYGQGGMSTCGLVAEGIYRRVGCDLADLYAPYVPGMAISRMLSYARKHGALRTAVDGLPRKGDYTVIGTAEDNKLHVLIPVQNVTESQCISVDGGQVDSKGLQAIYRLERSVKRESGVVLIGKRPLFQYVDAQAIGLLGKGLVPKGYR